MSNRARVSSGKSSVSNWCRVRTPAPPGQPGQRKINGSTIWIRVVEWNGEGGALPTVRVCAGRPGERRRSSLRGCLFGAAGDDRTEAEEQGQEEQGRNGKGVVGTHDSPSRG